MNRVLTVMFTDIKGFTERTSQHSRDDLRELLSRHERLLKPLFSSCHGEIVKTIGDAFMVAFESPTNAVICGLLIQDKLEAYNATQAEAQRIEIRIAINAGECEVAKHDLFGEAVNIAARLEAITEPNEIYFTEAVYLSMQKSEVPSTEVGLRTLKGIPNEIKVYRVLKDHTDERYVKLVERAHKGSLTQASTDFVRLFAEGGRPRAGEARSNRIVLMLAVLAVVVLVGALAFTLGNRGAQADPHEATVQAALARITTAQQGGDGSATLDVAIEARLADQAGDARLDAKVVEFAKALAATRLAAEDFKGAQEAVDRATSKLPGLSVALRSTQRLIEETRAEHTRVAEIERDLDTIQRAAKAGRYDQALASLKQMFDRHPNEPLVQEATRAIVKARVLELVEQGEHTQAVETFFQAQETWYWLAGLLDEAQLKAWEHTGAEAGFTINDWTGQARWFHFQARYPKDPALKFQRGMYLAYRKRGGIRMPGWFSDGQRLVFEALQEVPEYRADPELFAALTDRLASYRFGRDELVKKTLDLLPREPLIAWCHANIDVTDKKRRYARHNAFDLLTGWGENLLTPIERYRYHFANLQYEKSDRQRLQDSIAYFDALDEAKLQAFKKQTNAQITDLQTLSSREGDRVAELVAKRFPEAVRVFASNTVANGKAWLSIRLGCFKILGAIDGLTPELTFGFYRANLVTYDRPVVTDWMRAAIDYMIGLGGTPEQPKAEAAIIEAEAYLQHVIAYREIKPDTFYGKIGAELADWLAEAKKRLGLPAGDGGEDGGD